MMSTIWMDIIFKEHRVSSDRSDDTTRRNSWTSDSHFAEQYSLVTQHHFCHSVIHIGSADSNPVGIERKRPSWNDWWCRITLYRKNETNQRVRSFIYRPLIRRYLYDIILHDSMDGKNQRGTNFSYENSLAMDESTKLWPTLLTVKIVTQTVICTTKSELWLIKISMNQWMS